MNPLLTSGLLTSNNLKENSGLGGFDGLAGFSRGETGLLESPEFQAQFADILQQLAATGGKEQPLNFAALRELRPELVEQITEQLDISQEALLSLPATAVEAITRVLENKPAFTQGPNILPGLNAAKLLQPELAKEDVLLPSQVDGEIAEEVIKQKELVMTSLFKDAMPDDKLQLTPNLKEMVDKDVLQQVSALKLLNSEFEQKIFTGPLMPELHNVKLVEQLAALDKANVNSVNVLQGPLMQNSLRSEQQAVQLPRIDVPVNQPQWGQAVGERLMFMVNTKVQAANIILNPPELGPIEVRVNINNDQASVQFVSGHAVVRDAIEESFPRLREMFAQNGISLTDANVSQQSSQQERRFDYTPDEALTVNDVGLEAEIDATESELTKYFTNDGFVDHYV